MKIRGLVHKLPEIYQPIFGYEDLSSLARRPSRDRAAAICAVHDALHNMLSRPVRVLDLGCAQGFFSLLLASRGAKVLGVDSHGSNAELCLALAEANPKLDVQFKLVDVETVIADLKTDQYDLVLALSLFHHICHVKGQQVARELLGALAVKIPIALYEPALACEPLYWATSQPASPRALVADFAFAHTIARHPTHLSEMERPLLFCSNQYWYLGGALSRFGTWTDKQHEVVEHIYAGTRRYYFSDTRIAKYFLLEGPTKAANRIELETEISFLSGEQTKPEGWPQLVGGEIGDEAGWLVRELVQGERLSKLIAAQVPIDANKIIDSILGELVILEQADLYHSDLRLWNIIVRPNGTGSLIDYGAITKRKKDGSWPYNIYLSFLLFVREIVAGELVHAFPTRPPLLSPTHLPEPFRSWALCIWRRPTSSWSFKFFHETYKSHLIEDHGDGADPVDGQSGVTMQLSALENNLTLLCQHQELLWKKMDHLKSEILCEHDLFDDMIPLLRDLEHAFAQLNSLMAAQEVSRMRRAEIEHQLVEARASNALLTAELEKAKEDLEKRIAGT